MRVIARVTEHIDNNLIYRQLQFEYKQSKAKYEWNGDISK